ncbi:hypothetical protein MKZ38_003645 [Zalerion maritima]|uniref:Uncharacterized protein n=1 Tax=Zalerion maritima TaxID=339359 RepID=A0AAD5RNQ4_9PEZI|nr:hypothetical protein MKZ38_003645 [Zalerion maritima]
MSLGVAIQSAIFYYAGCTPCIDRYKKHEKEKMAVRNMKEREKNPITEGYEHPVAMNTNPYWKQEMESGPQLPRKKKSFPMKTNSQRRLTNQTESSASMNTVVSKQSARSSPNASEEKDREGSGDEWSARPHQREDEGLWGIHIRHFERYPSFTSTQADTILSSDGLPETSEPSRLGHRLFDAVFKAGESAGRLIEAARSPLVSREISDEDRSSFYRSSSIINPPVNDFHPPVVSSRPAHADGHKWMLQPPPPAAVMEGRVPVSRSSSMASQISSQRALSVGGRPPLGRIVHERLLKGKECSNITGGNLMVEPPYSTSTRRWSQGTVSGSVMSRISTHVQGHVHSRSRGLSLDGSLDKEAGLFQPRPPRRRTLEQMGWSHSSESGGELSALGSRARPSKANCAQPPMTIEEVPTLDELPQGRDSSVGDDNPTQTRESTKPDSISLGSEDLGQVSTQPPPPPASATQTVCIH